MTYVFNLFYIHLLPVPSSPHPSYKQRVFLGIFSLSNTTSSQGYIGIGKVIEMDKGVI